MHYCGIIIKSKEVSVPKSREVLGEVLVNRGFADWYSTNNYRERVINGKTELSLKEFKKIFSAWLKELRPIPKEEMYAINDTWAFCTVNEDEDADEIILPYQFYEYYGMPERRHLINIVTRAYKKSTMQLINKLLKKGAECTVVFLDYHN